MQPLVRVTGLTKTYREIVALQDVSLSVREGEVLGLIGPNGAGKTTLFECMAGVLPADSGRLSIGGQEIATADRGRHLSIFPTRLRRGRRKRWDGHQRSARANWLRRSCCRLSGSGWWRETGKAVR
jgi:ABC-type branched-subunit amino acid transport system ATPase component